MKDFFTRYKNPLTVVIVLIILGGSFVYSRLQTSLFPSITFPKIKIIADAGLQPVNKMMVTVTKPLENAIKQVPDLADVRSITSRGTCEISAFMNWSADIDLSQQRIESKIAQIRNDLPPNTQITVEKMNPSILPVMGYTLESNSSRTPIDMKQLALYTVKPFLSQVPGVAEIRIIGGKQKEYWLTLDPQKMGTLGITPDLLSTALNQTNFIQSNGYLQDYRQLYLTVTDATVHTPQELENIIVSNNGRRVIQLKDFATVSISPGVEYIKINANGKEGLLVAVIQQPNANVVHVAELISSKVGELKKILPAGVTIRPYYIQAEFVNNSIKSVTDSLWIGLILAIFVAIIFLRSLKASLTILLTIPVTICLTLIAIYTVGYTLNIMTLGAIAAAIGGIHERTVGEFRPSEASARPSVLHRAIRDRDRGAGFEGAARDAARQQPRRRRALETPQRLSAVRILDVQIEPRMRGVELPARNGACRYSLDAPVEHRERVMGHSDRRRQQ